VLGEPGAGASELLRQAYDRSFTSQRQTVPFYFRFRHNEPPGALGTRFVTDFLRQLVSFRRRDPSILRALAGPDELAVLALPSDGHLIDRLVTLTLGREAHAVEAQLASPVRAADSGVHSLVLLDEAHLVPDEILQMIVRIAANSPVPFVLSGLRRKLYALSGSGTLRIDRLTPAQTAYVITSTAERTGVDINPETSDLLALQLNCEAGHVRSLLDSAAERGASLTSFLKFQQVYTDEIFGGRLGRRIDAELKQAVPHGSLRGSLLAELSGSIGDHVPEDHLRRRLGADAGTLEGALERLHAHEIINYQAGLIHVDPSRAAVWDHIRGTAAVGDLTGTRARVISAALAVNLERGPQLLSSSYRKRAAFGLKELLARFDGRSVPSILLDNARFRHELRGAAGAGLADALAAHQPSVRLPQIVFSAHAGAYYPRLDEMCDRERAAVGLSLADGTRKTWIAAEIESKLEASRETAELWCDRLETVALASDLPNYTIWLVAPEGFTDDALAALAERNAVGTSRKQAELLVELLSAPPESAPTARRGDLTEITVPMGEEGELVTARTVEELGQRYSMPAKTVSQIKTALVEACINASEHSLSPERTINETFEISEGELKVTVSNRGLRLRDKNTEPAPDEGRRGWGLKLMRSLMDDVRIDETDDGTRIVMRKTWDQIRSPANEE
jgi:serine/threonine-protein kinase RsbW